MKELNEAKVLAVGPGAFDKDGKRLPMGVKSGDKVLIPQVRERRYMGLLYGKDVDDGHSSVAALSRLERMSTPFSGTTSKSKTIQEKKHERETDDIQHPRKDQRIDGLDTPKSVQIVFLVQVCTA